MSLKPLIDGLRKLRGGDPNVVGQASLLTMFNAIMPGEDDEIEAYLNAAPMGSDSPWSALSGLHFLRLHVVRQLVHQGPSQQLDPLNGSYLITDASFDGGLAAFVHEICRKLNDEVKAVYGRCVGFPGTQDPAAFLRWVEHNRIDNGTVLASYPHATLTDVRAGLQARERMAEFACRSQSMDAETLQSEFRAAFPAAVWNAGRRS